jgi:hypothetical protein
MYNLSMQDRNLAFLIFGLLLASYLLTYTGVIDSSDGLSMFATVESMVRRGAVDSNQLLWMGNQQGSFGPDGELYSRKGVGMALLALPLVWLAKLWPALGLVQTALLVNPLLTAFTGALVYRAGRRLGWQQATALATALVFGLATFVWPYTQGFFSDPVCGWGLFAALYGLLAYRQTGRKRYLLAGGAAWALAYLTRTINLLTLPLFVLALLWVLQRRTRHLHLAGASLAQIRLFLVKNSRPLISFFIPVVLAGLLSLWWNVARFGSPWATGYVESESFSGDWGAGLYGLLLGPARGFFWYSPVLILAVLGVGWFWRQARWLLSLIGALVLLYVLVYAKWYMWHGGYSWGPRFLVPLVPFLVLLCGPAWATLVERAQWGWLGRGVVWLLVLISVGVQWLGLAIPFSLVQDWLAESFQPLFAPETFTRVALSPLVLQWRYLQAEYIHFAWWQSGRVDLAALLATLAGALLGVILLARTLRTPATERLPTNWIYGLFLCLIGIALLVRYNSTSADAALRTHAGRVATLERPGDALLLLDPGATASFANVYHGGLPVYGLRQQPTLDESDTTWLNRLVRRYARLWVVPDGQPPEQSAWERMLRIEGYLLQEVRLPDVAGRRLALYAAPNEELLVETGLGTVFGDPALADGGITPENGWIRLLGYRLNTEAQPGDAILLALRWETLRTVGYDYHVFVHLLDAREEKIAQRDGQPVQWMRPTSTWQPGEQIVDHYGLLLPEELSPGDYTIVVGLYDPVTGQRLPVSAGPGDYAIELGPISINRGS